MSAGIRRPRSGLHLLASRDYSPHQQDARGGVEGTGSAVEAYLAVDEGWTPPSLTRPHGFRQCPDQRQVSRCSSRRQCTWEESLLAGVLRGEVITLNDKLLFVTPCGSGMY